MLSKERFMALSRACEDLWCVFGVGSGGVFGLCDNKRA